MADLEHLIVRHPHLYHMAEAGSWDSIRQLGLRSTTAMFGLFGVSEPKQTQYRPKDVVICHPEYGRATVRNQTPMPPNKLRTALTGTDMDPSQWYELLNGKVFFWSTPSRLHGFLTATAHKDRPHDVLTVCTRSLAEQYENEITLSPINSGTVRSISHTRGWGTFRTIRDYCCKKSHRPYEGCKNCPYKQRECFAELAVQGAVLDIERHTLSVDRWMGVTCVENVWNN